MPDVDLGERIFNLREDQAITQAELAERARISASTLSQIESGYTTPHISTVRKIARALEVSPQELRGKAQAQPREEGERQGEAARSLKGWQHLTRAVAELMAGRATLTDETSEKVVLAAAENLAFCMRTYGSRHDFSEEEVEGLRQEISEVNNVVQYVMDRSSFVSEQTQKAADEVTQLVEEYA